MAIGVLEYLAKTVSRFRKTVGGNGLSSGAPEVEVIAIAYTTDGTDNDSIVRATNPLPVRETAIARSLHEGTMTTVGGTIGPFTMGDTYKSFAFQFWVNGGAVTNVNYVDLKAEWRNSATAAWTPLGGIEQINTTVADDKSADLAQAFNYWQLRFTYADKNGTGTAPTINYSGSLIGI